MVYKHRENITRLRNGTEIGLRSAHKGENRVKQYQDSFPSSAKDG